MTSADPLPPGAPAPESVFGQEEFADRVLTMASSARQEVVICSRDLDRRIYGAEALASKLRAFLLEHRRGRLRGLVCDPRSAAQGGHRLVELSRVLSSRIEFRLPDPAQPAPVEEFVIVDQRALLIRLDARDVEARYYAQAPSMAREQLMGFERLWQVSPPAREFTALRL